MSVIEETPVNPYGLIAAEEVHSPEEVEKTAALQMTVQDAVNTESWLQSNYWALRWREADMLYQAPPAIMLWEGTTTPRANVNRFVVAETVNAILPQAMNGLFYEKPSFLLRPRPNQNQNSIRAITELLSMELSEAEFRQEIEMGLFNCLLFGTGIWKWYFRTYARKIKKFVRNAQPSTVPSSTAGEPARVIDTPLSDEFSYREVEEEVNLPVLENRDVRFVLVDPGCRVPNIRKAKFVIDKMYMTYRDLIKLASEEYVYTDPKTKKQSLRKRYDLPSEETIRGWFAPPSEQPAGPGLTGMMSEGSTVVHHAKPPNVKTTVDPLDQPLEVLERWDNDKVITVLQRRLVIRNEANEFGCIPFFSLNWWNIPDSFWGIGIGRVVGGEQRVQVGLINALLDVASLIVNPMYIRAKGQNASTQQIRQRLGGIIEVDGDVRTAFHMLEQPPLPAEILNQIGMSEARVEKATGATAAVMGSGPGPKGQLGRSGTGAAAIAQATLTRLGAMPEDFVHQVFEPWLYRMHELNKAKLPLPYIRSVLGKNLGSDFTFRYEDFLNAPVEFEVLAGSHLAAKAQMAQSLFMMLQLFENAPLMSQLAQVSHKKVNIEELFHMVHDLSGFKNYYNVIEDMTPEEEARQNQVSNPAVAKIQGAMAENQQKFQQKQALIDQDNEAQAARIIIRHGLEVSSQPEELTGTPSAVEGFGSNEQA